jgi:hypothetical protein
VVLKQVAEIEADTQDEGYMDLLEIEKMTA